MGWFESGFVVSRVLCLPLPKKFHLYISFLHEDYGVIIIQMKLSSSETDIEHSLSKTCTLLHRNSISLFHTIYWCIAICLLRLSFVILSFFYSNQLITTDKQYQSAGSWHIVYYVISSLMDIIVLINQISMLQKAKKDRRGLIQAIDCLKQGKQVTWVSNIGEYIEYSSIYNVIKHYRFGVGGKDSLTDSIRMLQTSIVFPSFAIPALIKQCELDAPLYKMLILWGFMFSIYYTTFEMDYSKIEESDGPYMAECEIEDETERKFLEEDIKRNFINACLRPPQIVTILGVCIVALGLYLTLSLTVFSGIVFSCVFCHIALLIHEKKLQQQLYDVDLKQLPYKFLNPFKIMSFIIKQPRWHYFLYRTCRFTTVFTCFAFCYMAPQLRFWVEIILIVGVGLLVSAHYWRLDVNQTMKLYVIRTKRFEDLSELGTPKDMMDCAICLVLFVDKPNDNKVIQLPCFSNHVFHRDCLKGWLGIQYVCPLCRSPLDEYRIK